MSPIGFWGEPTSTLDWCEQNYEVNYYFAEFWNTVTNLSMIIPPFYGVSLVLKYNLEKRFILCYLFYLLIGIGSWMFHMTLKYEMQLLDELPMVYASAIFVYCLHEVSSVRKQLNGNLIAFLVIYCFLVTVVYLKLKNPIFHETMYGFLVVWMMYMDYEITKKHYSKATVTLFVVGICMYLLGFLLWNIDNHFCDSLEFARKSLLPRFLGPLTQLHGWWHLLAGYSTHIHILANIYHRERSLARKVYSFSADWIGLTIESSDLKEA